MSSLLITRGRVVDPASGLDAVTDILIENGRIATIGSDLTQPPAVERIDAAGLIVCPGLIDPHVHLREPGQEHKETIATGTRAAVAGGFTTVCCMPNTTPALDSPEAIDALRERARETGACRVFPVGAVTLGRKGEQLAEIGLMAEHGAVAFSDDGDVVESPAVMLAGMRQIARTGRVMMQHCQEPSLTRGASMHAGTTATRLGLTGWPPIAEELVIERDVRLAAESGCRYHVQHISAAASVDLVREARERHGELISAEASPHHLLLTDEACEGFNTMAKMNPPVRSAADREAIARGVQDGVITVLATDHAPHTAEEKALDFESAPFGIIGLETALALYIEALVTSGRIGWPGLIELMTVNPARLCGLDRLGIGRLEPGGLGDVTIIDPELEWEIGLGDLAGKGVNTPFLGRKVRGRAVRTIVGGKTAWALGEATPSQTASHLASDGQSG
jgi:dihydroorotase